MENNKKITLEELLESLVNPESLVEEGDKNTKIPNTIEAWEALGRQNSDFFGGEDKMQEFLEENEYSNI